MVIRNFSLFFSLLLFSAVFSQSINDSINKNFIKQTLFYLASDKLGGRINFSKGQLEAAEFINNEFSSYHLNTFTGGENYYMPFQINPRKNMREQTLKWNGHQVDDSLFRFFSHTLYISSKKLDDFMVLRAECPLADSLLYYNWAVAGRDLLLWVVLPDGVGFSEATRNMVFPAGMPASDILIVAAKDEPEKIKFPVDNSQLSSVLYNVVGVIPGRSLVQEAIIFSAHYDHVGRGIGGQQRGVYNGANDDASGTTAVLALAKYFAAKKNNERTLVFCLFAGEELGLLGSGAFVNYLKVSAVKAVINIEMIGMTNRTGKNSFVVTGAKHSTLEEILEKNLAAKQFRIIKEKDDPTRLFERSDNFSFYKKGVPAHSIICSDDNEPCYHKPCDDAYRIDTENMTRVIKAIADGCTTLINGTDTPVLQ